MPVNQTTRQVGPVWVTKYALTGGISRYERGEINAYISEDMMSVPMNGAPNGRAYFHKPFWHLSERDAVQHARDMRERKIQSLLKQVSKLKTVVFEVTDAKP